jgi:hypothetical protein
MFENGNGLALQGNPGALALGLSLLSSPDLQSGFTHGLNNMVNFQTKAQQAALQQQQFNLEKLKFLQSQDQFNKNFGLQQGQDQRAQKEFESKMSDQQRKLSAGQNISKIFGEEPSMINNFQGSGYLGNMEKLDPLMRARLNTAQELAQSGDISTAASYLPTPEKPSFGQPVGAINAQGKPTYFMTDNSGNIKPIDGYSPEPKKGMMLTTNADGTVSFQMGGSGVAANGNSPLTQASANDAQKGLMDMTQNLARLNQIGNTYKSNFLTYQGKAMGATQSVLNKAGITDNVPFLRAQTIFKNNVDQNFNQYRKEITGAAASVQELERLKTTMMNTDQSPAEFEASFKQFTDLISSSIQLKQHFISQGIPANSKQMGQLIDEAVMKKTAMPNKNASSASTFSEAAFEKRDVDFGLPKGTSKLVYQRNFGKKR